MSRPLAVGDRVKFVQVLHGNWAIPEGAEGTVVPNDMGMGVHVQFDNGMDSYAWSENLTYLRECAE